MQRVAFLRSVEIQQAAPYVSQLEGQLRADGIEARLFYTDAECGPEDFPGEAERLPRNASCDEVTERLLDWGAEGVVSLSIPDENALRDSLVKESLAGHGIPMVMHPPHTTRLLANKWDTKEAVRAFGLRTPEGVFLDGDVLNRRNLPVPAYADLVRRTAAVLGYPLLAKPLWDCLANGVSFLDTPASLAAYLRRPYDGNAILERCLPGELCSVEIVGRSGAYTVQPLVWKGRTGGAPPSFVFETVRYSAPREETDALFAPVADRLRTLCTSLDIEGAVEVEMIHREGVFQVIEINPRVSGSTTLSIAASGCNTYMCLLDLLVGRWSAERARALEGRRRTSVQFPVRTLAGDARERLADAVDVVRASSFHIGGREYANAVATCEFGDGPDIVARLQELEDVVDASVIEQLAPVVSGGLPTS